MLNTVKGSLEGQLYKRYTIYYYPEPQKVILIYFGSQNVLGCENNRLLMNSLMSLEYKSGKLKNNAGKREEFLPMHERLLGFTFQVCYSI